MTKSIDLNNTWCEATEENIKEINNLNLQIVGMWIEGKIINLNGATYSFGNTIQENRKQIHLVKGEFQYVESKPKNKFKDYGFEANFEGEILKEVDRHYIGWARLNFGVVSISINKDTNILSHYFGSFKLNQIKKEWYENSDNIGKFISINNTLGIFKSYAKENETIIYINLVNNLEYIIHISKCRPATQEEVLSLLIKE